MQLSDFAEVTLIQKGWSNDKKYCAVAKDGQKYLLRISPVEQYDRKKREYECMQKVAMLGIPMCEAIEFGTCEEGVYSLQTWIEGTDAETAVKELTEDKVYEYGLEAGRILKKIHSIPAPVDAEDRETFFNRKMDRKIKMYQDCPLKYENGDAFIRHIEANRHLLKNRPLAYQHGDYHIGNFMIDKSGQLVVIDFNRNEYGDPWEEFNRIVWCAQAAPLFATGMVDGYFDGNVPMEFWNLLALYIASNSLSSLPWAIPFGQGEIDVMRKQAAEILSWYDNMTHPVPNWYRPREQWNAYTADEVLTDKILIRDEPIPDGLYHLVCEVLVRHVDGSYLCMKRAMTKPVYPGLYEATAGGSALLGEDKWACVKRELAEETGIQCDEFEEIGHHVSKNTHAIYHHFVCTVDCKKDSVKLQEGETEDYKWMTEEEFIRFINSGEMIDKQRLRYHEYFVKKGYVR